MRKNKLLFLVGVAVVAVGASALTTTLMPRRQAAPAVAQAKEESVYDRVMRTRTLRCGYFIEAPFTRVDANTGARSGIAHDLAEKLGKELGLKVEWTQEVNFATLAEDLSSGRYDAVCASVFVLPRSGRTDYTRPYTYVPVHGYVRTSDARFDKPFNTIDWSQARIGGLDGEGATTAAQKLLPQARFDILPQSSQISDMLAAVAAGKTDIGFVLPSVYQSFSKGNPNVLKEAALDRPLYTYAVAFALPAGQPAFKDMLDNVILQLTVSGELQAIIGQYDPGDLFIRPAYK